MSLRQLIREAVMARQQESHATTCLNALFDDEHAVRVLSTKTATLQAAFTGLRGGTGGG